MDFFKTQINEDEWTIYLIENEDEDEVDGLLGGGVAATEFEAKELYFGKDDIYLACVLHELWHVYFKYCYLGDTSNIGLEDMEEITCALFADKAEKIIVRAKEIHEKLLAMRETNENN